MSDEDWELLNVVSCSNSFINLFIQTSTLLSTYYVTGTVLALLHEEYEQHRQNLSFMLFTYKGERLLNKACNVSYV